MGLKKYAFLLPRNQALRNVALMNPDFGVREAAPTLYEWSKR
jgi:hypothetical protein